MHSIKINAKTITNVTYVWEFQQWQQQQ